MAAKKTPRGRKSHRLVLNERILQILAAAARTLDFGGELTYHSYSYLYNALGKLEAEEKEDVDRTLTALAKQGLVQIDRRERQVCLTLDDQLEQSLRQARRKKWDGKWRVVVFDIPEIKRGVRDDFRWRLKKLGLALWQRSVWVTPFDMVKALNAYLIKNNLSSHVQIMVGMRVGEQGDREFAASLWPLLEINRRYTDLLQAWEKELGRQRSGPERLAVVRKLHGHYLAILADDPQLPPSLLPTDWQSERASALFKTLRSTLALGVG